MRPVSLFNNLFIVGLATIGLMSTMGLVACGSSHPQVLTPLPQTASTEFSDPVYPCDHIEDAWNVTDAEKKAAITVTATVPSIYIEDVNCSGEEVSARYMPVENFGKTLPITPPALGAPVDHVQIDNYRTCTRMNLNAQAKSLNSTNAAANVSVADSTGLIDVYLYDFKEKNTSEYLNITDGLNLIEVTYFGAKNQELGTQRMVVMYTVDRSHVQSKQQRTVCKTR